MNIRKISTIVLFMVGAAMPGSAFGSSLYPFKGWFAGIAYADKSVFPLIGYSGDRLSWFGALLRYQLFLAIFVNFPADKSQIHIYG